jgi:hypothetical protein
MKSILSYMTRAVVLTACLSALVLATTNSQQYAIREVTLTNLPPNPLSVFVRFTDPLDDSHSEDLTTVNATVKTLPSGESLEVSSLSRHPANRRELVIDIKGAAPAGAEQIQVCFASLHFLDKAGKPHAPSGTPTCRVGDILTRENIDQELSKAWFALMGRVDSTSERTLRNIRVTQALLDPGTVSDAFGGRIARRYLAIQVTVANSDPDYKFLIHDIVIQVPQRKIQQSSIELSILRGTAERGQLNNGRNVLDRILKGVGSILAGALVIDKFGHSYAPSVAIFNGPLITAYEAIFPDFTIHQMNRLNDSAYSANKIVGARQALVMVAFIPQDQLLTLDEKKNFGKDPHTFLENFNTMLSATTVYGNLITNVEEIAPSVTSVVFGDDPKKFQADNSEIGGYVLGQFLSDSTVSLGEGTPDGTSISVEGTPTDTRLDFKIKSKKPVPPNKNLEFVVTKGKNSAKFTRTVQYLPDTPTLQKLDPSSGAPGSTVPITATGTNFLPDNTQVVLSDGCTGVSLPNSHATVTDSKTLTFSLQIDANAVQTTCKLKVMTFGNPSQEQSFAVKK